jgi:hypothetical protein
MAEIAGKGARLPGNRSRKRDSMLLKGTIRAAGDDAPDAQPIRIRNLSSTGLMAVAPVGPVAYEEGAIVEIELRGIGLIRGDILWVRGLRMGITFHEAVDPMLARRPVVARNDDHPGKLVNIGRLRRPGLRIGRPSSR